MPAPAADLNGKLCMITGASSGIGRATALALAPMGARLVLVCRDRSRGEAVIAEIAARQPEAAVDLLIADLASPRDIRRAAGEFAARYDRLDVLVNNAGALFTSREVTADGFERTFATNHLNYFLLTNLLLDPLRRAAPARVINVSSRAHMSGAVHFDDLQLERRYSPMRAYSQSKLANVLFTYELARRLEDAGVTANALHPGVVRTGFAKNNRGLIGGIARGVMSVAGTFFLSPEQGAETPVYLASSDDVAGVTGRYFFRCAETASSPASHDREVAQRLWDVSGELTGLSAGVAPTG
jgi:NAD(P)-dependent dehydrogenase (short-subunit alcohol dehydrogenase family)